MARVVFARIEVVRQCCSQFDDPTPEFLAELIQLYFMPAETCLSHGSTSTRPAGT